MTSQKSGAHAGTTKGVENQGGTASLSPPCHGLVKRMSCVGGNGFYPRAVQVSLDSSIKIYMNVFLITIDWVDHGLRRSNHLVIIT